MGFLGLKVMKKMKVDEDESFFLMHLSKKMMVLSPLKNYFPKCPSLGRLFLSSSGTSRRSNWRDIFFSAPLYAM